MVDDARLFVRRFRKLPTAYGPKLAERLGVPVEVAGAILEKLVVELLAELGDLEGEARRVIEMAWSPLGVET
jgi:hypothetical protein